jgi:serine protease Do
VKIEAEGTFIDPEVGEQRNSAGVGSGVIISDDGLVVTNNHVVTGAALLRVAIPGIDDPVNAQVLGVSECSDLAAIQLAGESPSEMDRAERHATRWTGTSTNTSTSTKGQSLR